MLQENFDLTKKFDFFDLWLWSRDIWFVDLS